jgi:hypothetical protein
MPFHDESQQSGVEVDHGFLVVSFGILYEHDHLVWTFIL